MSKMIIIDGNANDKDNVRAYMVKGEPGLSPVANVSKTGDTATISITDKNGTTTTTIKDGDTPTASVSKSNHVATITITDEDGTTTATVSDGADLTDGAVPTGAVIGFDGETPNIPGGFEVSTMLAEGTWTPSISTQEGATPTMTYQNRRGYYKKIGNMVFISFYLRGKITALTGTNNYGIVTGLPFSTKSIAMGENSLSLGCLYSLLEDTTNVKLNPYGSVLRLQNFYGTSSAKLKVTNTNYFELGGSGWYEIN